MQNSVIVVVVVVAAPSHTVVMNRMAKDRDAAVSLSLEEKKYLLAVQRGDVANVQR